MRRGLLAVAALVGVLLAVPSSQVQADYVIVVANVGQKKTQDAGARGVLGFGGFAGMAGVPPGAQFGGRPGAQFGGMAGMAGMAGMGGFPPGAQIGGRPGAQFGGGPPGAQFGGVRPGGVAGFFGNVGGNVQKGSPIRVMAVLETKNFIKQVPHRDKSVTAYVDTELGKGNLWSSNVEMTILTRGGKRLPAVHFRFDKLLKDLSKDGAKPSTQEMVNLAVWALEHGLVDECGRILADLKDMSNPAVAAFHKVQAALKLPVKGDREAARWKQVGLFDRYRVATSAHYALLHDKTDDSAHEVTSRLAHLERIFTVFYYWHALQGVALDVPRQRLVAILDAGKDAPQAFLRDNGIFGSVPITADSFYSPRHNLVVFCGKRLDQPYSALTKLTESYWRSFNMNQVLQAKPSFPRNSTEAQRYSAQTLALLTKALDEDGEAAAVSHSGTRQLLTASGLLPRSVTLPQWLQSGTGSFFETPYGSPWKMYGAPHWVYLFSYQELDKQKKLAAPHQLLRDVITDKYFKESKKKGKPSVKARATAWALTYYLARNRLPELMRFYKELSRLPRDLDFDDAVLLRCFARAFGCVDGRNKFDEAKFTSLANTWVSEMANVPGQLDNEVRPMLEQIFKLQNELKDELEESNKPKPGTGGGTPGFPGGGSGRPPGFPGGSSPRPPGFPGGSGRPPGGGPGGSARPPGGGPGGT